MMKGIYTLAISLCISVGATAQNVVIDYQMVNYKEQLKKELASSLDTATIDHAYEVIGLMQDRLPIIKEGLSYAKETWTLRSRADEAKEYSPQEEVYDKTLEIKKRYILDRQQEYLDHLYFWQSVRYPDSNIQLFSKSGIISDMQGVSFTVNTVYYNDGTTYTPNYDIAHTLLVPTAKVVDSVALTAHCKAALSVDKIRFASDRDLYDGRIEVEEIKDNYAKLHLYGTARYKEIYAINKDGKYLRKKTHDYEDFAMAGKDTTAVRAALPRVKVMKETMATERETITIPQLKQLAIETFEGVEHLVVNAPVRTLHIFFEGNIEALAMIDEVTGIDEREVVAHNVNMYNGRLICALDNNSNTYGFVDTMGEYTIIPKQYDVLYPELMKDIERINSRYYMQEIEENGHIRRQFYYLDEDKNSLMVLDKKIDNAYSYNGINQMNGKLVCSRPADMPLPLRDAWHDAMTELGMVAQLGVKKAFFSKYKGQVTAFEFDDIVPISLSRLAAKNGSKWALMDISGKILTDYIYQDVKACKDDEDILVKKDGKRMFVDKFGTPTIDISMYDEVQPFVNGLAKVRKNRKFGFIDTEGNEAIPIIFSETSDYFVADHILVANEDGKKAVINSQRQILIPFSDSGTAVLLNDDIRFYYFNDIVYDQQAKRAYNIPEEL